MSDQLSIHTLGGLSVHQDGQPLTFGQRKTLALLVYLACNPRPHPREVLAEMLWEDRTQSQSLSNLRVVLTDLRHTVGEHVCVTRETVAVNTESDLWLDADAFEAQLAEAGADYTHIGDTLALYQGDFLDGFFIDSQGYEDWALLERERLRFRAMEALDTFIANHLDDGDYASGIARATQLLRMDTLREKTYRQLMQILALSGQRAAALAQYETCRRTLHDELGVTPTSETVQLFEEIRIGTLVEIPRSVPVAQPVASEPVSYIPARPRHNLPVQATSFVGREDDIAAATDQLADPDCRLLTLVGPGGMGKTRLALAVAERLVDVFSDGVVFVPLAPVVSPDGIVMAMATALQVPFSHGQEGAGQILFSHLYQKQMLLVLDNFEHLLDGADLVSQLLSAAPQVALLVTSREALGLSWEWLHEVRGLSHPDGGGALEQYDAIRLFIERARRAHPGFRWSDELDNIARIARLVDGMPLGIEIAAAWLRMLPCEAIAAELLDLSFAQRDVPQRHHSLRILFDHTWAQLSPTQQRVLRELSVFRGGFSREAAETVAGASLPTLVALVHKSLVHFNPANRRYGFHELLRQYASEKLSSSPEEHRAVLDRHGSFFARLLSERESKLMGGVQLDTLLDADNIWMAWDWALAGHHFTAIGLMWQALFAICEMQNWPQQGYELFSLAVEAMADVASLPDAAPLFHLSVAVKGWFAILSGRPAEGGLILEGLNPLRQLGWSKERVQAEECSMWMNVEPDRAVIRWCIAECIAYCRSRNWPDHIPGFLTRLAALEAYEHHLEDAIAHYQESIALSRELDTPYDLALNLASMGESLVFARQWQRAEGPLREAVALCRAQNYRRILAGSLNALAYVELEQNHALTAQRYAEDAVTLCQEVNNRNFVLRYRDTLGVVKYAMEDFQAALLVFQQNLAASLGPGFDVVPHLRIGFCLLKLHKPGEARGHLVQVLRYALAADTVDPFLVADSILGSALVCAALGKHDKALEWVGVTSPYQWLDKYQQDDKPILIAQLEAQFGPDAVEAAIERGKDRDLFEVAREVLAELEQST